jgi:opacity protein-like surface antigen
MNKNIVVIILLSLFMITESLNAQSFKKGTNVLNIGIGFPNFPVLLLKINGYNSPDYRTGGTGPIHIRYEHAFTGNFGLGLSVNFNSYSTNWITKQVVNNSNITYNNTIKGSSINFLVRANKHWTVDEKVDVYIGAGIGYNHRKHEEIIESVNDRDITKSFKDAILPIGIESTLGVRYYLTKNIGAYLDLGYAKDIIQTGIVASF